MVELSEVTKSFGDREIFSKVSLTISSGEVCGLVGLNGIGKSTLIRAILGLISVDSGSIKLFGSTFLYTPELYKSIGVILDSDGFSGNLNFFDNLSFYAQIRDISTAKLKSYIDNHWSHLSTKKEPIKTFSKGERMQCSIARAFLGEPKILLLDEPTVNLDFKGEEQLKSLVVKAKERGASILISSHSFSAISSMCDSYAHLSEAGLTKSLFSDSKVWVIKVTSGIQRAISIIESCDYSVKLVEDSTLIVNGVDEDGAPSLIRELVNGSIDVVQFYVKDSLSYLKEIHYESH